MPQMKLVSRVREKGHVKRVYELDIPLNRVLKLDEVNAKTKAKLVKLRDSIDIVRLSEKIEELSEALTQAYEKKLRRYKDA